MKFNSKSEKYFKDFFINEWEKLRSQKDSIFENINFALDFEKEYKKFKESEKYQEFLHENSEYKRKKIIHDYFYQDFIIPVLENLLVKSNELDMTAQILLEHTYEEILKKKVLTENEFKIYLNLKESFLENPDELKKIINESELLEGLIEESILDQIKNYANKTLHYASVASANFMKILGIIDTFLRLVFVVPVRGVDIILTTFGINLYKLNKEDKLILKSLTLNNTELKEFMEAKLNIKLSDLINECWNSSLKFYVVTADPKVATSLQEIHKAIMNLFNGTLNPNIVNKMRNLDAYVLLSELKNNEKFGRMVHKYRICIFTNVIDYVKDFIVVTASTGEVRNSLIQKLKELERNKAINFTHIFDFKPQTKAEKVFLDGLIILYIIKALILEIRDNIKRINFRDLYIADDIRIIENKLNQAVQEINEELNRLKGLPKTKKYEETNNDNKRKELVGNEPTKPQKISVFDL